MSTHTITLKKVNYKTTTTITVEVNPFILAHLLELARLITEADYPEPPCTVNQAAATVLGAAVERQIEMVKKEFGLE